MHESNESKLEEESHAISRKLPDLDLWDRMKSRHRLISFDLEVTARCNNDCRHCYICLPASDKAAKKCELTLSEIMNVADQAVKMGALWCLITGGEPLLRDDFEDIYIFARRLGLKILLFTNATLITPTLADLFARIPPREMIEVSVYGMSERSYEAVSRTPGSFQAAMRGMRMLKEGGIPFVVKSAVLPPNKEELDEFDAWAATIPWMETPPSYSTFFDLRARRDSEVKNEQIKSLRLSPEEGIAVLSRDHKRDMEEMRQFCTKFMKPSGERLFSCGLPLPSSTCTGIGPGTTEGW